MRFVLVLLLVALTLASACARKKHSAAQKAATAGAAPNQKLIVTPDFSLAGRVASVNVEGRFVILTFPPGHLPAADQQLNLYHHGIKAGTLKVSGQQLNENVVADIVNGQAEVGDEAREK